MSNTRKDTGKKGENIAADYLAAQNFSIMERNWRYKHCEVDIIASKDNCLHFIEVKTRRNDHFGYPEESIGREKMTALKKAAEAYLYRNTQWKNIQFDAISIILEGETVKEILWIDDVYF
jgi:putative endonuclease